MSDCSVRFGAMYSLSRYATYMLGMKQYASTPRNRLSSQQEADLVKLTGDKAFQYEYTIVPRSTGALLLTNSIQPSKKDPQARFDHNDELNYHHVRGGWPENRERISGLFMGRGEEEGRLTSVSLPLFFPLRLAGRGIASVIGSFWSIVRHYSSPVNKTPVDERTGKTLISV